MSETRVWYAGYGSNLAWDRFRCYIHGGSPADSSGRYDGCRLKQDPIDMRPYELPYPLYFACRAPKWGGAGVAFVGHRPYPERPTMARLFLLEHQQFEDVVAQENGQLAGKVVVSIETAITNGYQDVRDTGWYRRVLHVGALDGYPVLTCTAAWDIGEEEPVAPALGYLRWICMGLRESWGVSSAEIASYLLVSPGMTAYGSQTELQSVIDGLLANVISGAGTGPGK